MTNELETTWNDISTHWDDWKAPLRPAPADITIIQEKLSDKSFPNPAKVFILGVTPELVTMDFGFPTYITAMDRSESMIQNVWPGNLDGYRQAVLGDWVEYTHKNRSYDLVLADGSLVFFNPLRLGDVMVTVMGMLKIDGYFVFRNFTQPSIKETIGTIESALKEGQITNFHSFKFRVAMALQKDFTTGVSQAEVYNTIQALLASYPEHPFSEADLGTLSFYQGKRARHHFPTIDELNTALGKWFKNITITYPEYEFGNCCPIISCSR